MKYLKFSRGISSFLVILLSIIILTTVGGFILKEAFEQSKIFYDNRDIYIEQVNKIVENINIYIDKYFGFVRVNENIENIVSQLLTFLMTFVFDMVKIFFTMIILLVPKFFMGITLTFISMFFFLKDKELIEYNIKKITPNFVKKNLNVFKSGIIQALIGYLKSELIMMSITFCITLIATLIIVPEYAVLISVVVAIIDALPIFGSSIFLWPWSMLVFLSGNSKMAVYIIILFLVIVLVKQLTEPKVLGKQIGIHPVLTIISIYIGVKIFGLFGFIIGPIIAIIIKIVNQNINYE